MRSTKVAVLVIILAVIVAIALLALSGPALTDTTSSPSASPSTTATPTPTASPTVTPAPASVVHRALKQRRRAVRAWSKWNHARWCLAMPHRPFASPRPARAADAATWTRAGRHWRQMRSGFRRRTGRLLHQMRYPGGSSSGVRWIPLARYVGWPGGTLSHLAYIIQRESSGRPNAYNGVIGCTGLLQIWPGHVSDPWRLKDPEYNLRVGLRLYRTEGWAPWAL